MSLNIFKRQNVKDRNIEKHLIVCKIILRVLIVIKLFSFQKKPFKKKFFIF